MDYIFRKVDETNQTDIEQFCELMNDLSKQANDKELLIKNIKKINKRDDAYLIVVEDVKNSKICASVLLILFDDFCDMCRPVMVIENVVTHHDYQRKGIARLMFDKIDEIAKEHNVNYTMLCSSLNRTGAHKFYDSIEYTETKGYKKYF